MATPYPIKPGSDSPELSPSPRLTAEQARRLWSYDPETGVLTWKVNIGTRAKAGEVAGGVQIVHASSYRWVRIHGKRYLAHRLAYLLYYGAWPSGEIDHIDHDGLNNRIENLRAVPRDVNARNQRRHSTNTSGVTGVHWDPRDGKWHARIYIAGSEHRLGLFETLAEAAHARKLAERLHDYHQNHGAIIGCAPNLDEKGGAQ